MQRVIFIWLVSLLFGTQLQAQTPQDVIYLNNGSVVKGKIIPTSSTTTVTIQTTDGKQYEYAKTEIRKTSKEDVVLPKDPKNPKYKHFEEFEKGYWIAGEVMGGGSIMHGKKNVGFTQLSVVNGYRVNDFFRVGIGLGVRYYIENSNRRVKSSEWSFPVYLDMRGNFTSQRVDRIAPFWMLDTGVAFTDGFFVSPTFGVKFGGHRSNFLLGLTYLGQNLRAYAPVEDGVKKTFEFNHFLALKVGYEF